MKNHWKGLAGIKWLNSFRREPLLDVPSAPHTRHSEKSPDVTVEVKYGAHSLLQRLGSWAVAVLVGGTVIIAAACAFLIFLWTSSDKNDIWKRIMTSGRASTAIALTSLVIRTAIGTQAVVCTAMLASLALEKGEAALSRAAALSGIRYSNAGPLDIVVEFFRGKTGGVIPLISSLLLLTGLTSQFSSAILLSDLTNSQVLGYPVDRRIPYGIARNSGSLNALRDTNGNYYKARPLVYPAFAEYRESAVPREGLHSTGLTLRGFLPFSDAVARGAVSEYIGKASVIDATVTCVRPVAEFNVSLETIASWPNFFLNGTIKPAGEVPGAVKPKPESLNFQAVGQHPGPFPSDLQTLRAGQGQGWQTSLTPLKSGYGGDGLVGYFSRSLDPNGTPEYGKAYLVLNTSHLDPSEYADADVRYADPDEYGSITDVRLLEPSGEWQNYGFRVTRDYPEPADSNNIWDTNVTLRVSLSLCYTAWSSLDVEVRARSSSYRTEPTLGWDNSFGSFNTSATRAQLELGYQPREVRQRQGYIDLAAASGDGWPADAVPGEDSISRVNLDSVGTERTKNESLTYDFLISADNLGAADDDQNYTSYLFASFPGTGGKPDIPRFKISSESFHPAHAAIFRDTLGQTSHPAIALQSLLTIGASSQYYDKIEGFSAEGDATYILYQTALVPGRRYSGLFAVLAIFAAHFLLVITVTALFATRSRWSLIGNSWQTVSQTTSLGETNDHDVGSIRSGSLLREALFELSSLSTDELIRDRIQNAGFSGREAVVLTMVDDSGRIAVRLRGDQPSNNEGPLLRKRFI